MTSSQKPSEMLIIDLKSKYEFFQYSYRNIEDSNNIFQELLNTCSNVIDLDISYNKLTFLPSNLTSFNFLKRLDLRGNPLKQVIKNYSLINSLII